MIQQWISEFNPASEAAWKAQLLKELKGNESNLLIHNKIEEITYSTYHYPDSVTPKQEDSTLLPIQRGFKTLSNQWKNGIEINTTNAIEANKKALHALMSGCDYIHFVSAENTNWKHVLNEIELAYIHTTFTFTNPSDFITLIQFIPKDLLPQCSFNLPNNSIENNEIKDLIKSIQVPIFQIDGFSINQCGANAIQELGFVIEQAHEALVKLLDLGLSIDQASACIHFRMGIGNNYLVEIAKFRGLKILWSNLIKHYQPEHTCSYNCQITAEVGWVNKSLKDPHTNLLRQTTEAMSAIIGGIDRLIIHPHDEQSTQGASELAQRMALNISNLLQDESYLATVNDPLGGSYALEKLTQDLSEKSWELFKTMDQLPTTQKETEWQRLVQEKANQRIEMIKNSETVILGINKFPNPQPTNNQWLPAKQFNNLSFLRLETEIQ